MITFTNGKISLCTDLIFGVCVLDETGWIPLSELSAADRRLVASLLDYNPTCPEKIRAAVYDKLNK